MSNNRNTIEERLAILETKIVNLCDRFDHFVGNDFHSLAKKVDKLSGRPSWGIATLIITKLWGILLKIAVFTSFCCRRSISPESRKLNV